MVKKPSVLQERVNSRRKKKAPPGCSDGSRAVGRQYYAGRREEGMRKEQVKKKKNS